MSRNLRWGIVLLWVILIFVNHTGPQSAGASAGRCTSCIENSGTNPQFTRGAGIEPAQVTFSPLTASVSDCPTTFEVQVILLINVERSKVGIPALALDSRLQSPARWFSNDVVINGLQDPPHNGSDGSTPQSRATAAGYIWTWVGETMILGSGGAVDTPEEVVQGWMSSDPHKAILLHTTPTHIGVGYTHDPLGVPYEDVSIADFGSTDGPRQGPPASCDPGFFQIHFPIVTK